MQAKNEAQSVEINRLERQLKILAELQVSIVNCARKLHDMRMHFVSNEFCLQLVTTTTGNQRCRLAKGAGGCLRQRSF